MARNKRYCYYCGKSCARSVTRDHMIPRCHGGAGVALVDACLDCNQKKGRLFLDEWRVKFGRPFVGEVLPIGRPSWRWSHKENLRHHPTWEFAEKISRALEAVWLERGGTSSPESPAPFPPYRL